MRKGLAYSVLMASLMAACTLTPKDMGKSFMFRLPPINIVQQGKREESLVVALPAAAAELDTYRIALLRDGRQWDYYAGAKWADFLPLLVQDNLTQTLENARIFKAVTADRSGLSGDKILKTEIRNFEAEYAAGSAVPVIKLRMVMTLLTRVDRQRLASFEISAAEKAKGQGLADIQAAFAAAFVEAERQLVENLGRKWEVQ